MLHLSHIEYKFTTISKQTFVDYIRQNATENGNDRCILKLGYEKETNAYKIFGCTECVCTVKSKHAIRADMTNEKPRCQLQFWKQH